MTDRGTITQAQYAYLLNPLKSTRIAKRSQGGKQLSYLESWDVRAHLIRIFGFGNFDAELISSNLVYQRDIEVGEQKRPGWEVAYKVEFRLSIYDGFGCICTYSEAAVGSASGSVDLGGLHDNALKTAASDALKRCAINLGTQFGLSLYNDGSREDVVRTSLVIPDGAEPDKAQEATDSVLTPEQTETLERVLGAAPIPEGEPEALPDGPQFENRIDTPQEAKITVDGIVARSKK